MNNFEIEFQKLLKIKFHVVFKIMMKIARAIQNMLN